MKWRVPGQEVDQRKLGELEIVEKDCKARGLNREDAMDRSRWRKRIGMIGDHNECAWVNVSSGNSSPTHTHSHFTALLDFVWDYPGELVPER